MNGQSGGYGPVLTSHNEAVAVGPYSTVPGVAEIAASATIALGQGGTHPAMTNMGTAGLLPPPPPPPKPAVPGFASSSDTALGTSGVDPVLPSFASGIATSPPMTGNAALEIPGSTVTNPGVAEDLVIVLAISGDVAVGSSPSTAVAPSSTSTVTVSPLGPAAFDPLADADRSALLVDNTFDHGSKIDMINKIRPILRTGPSAKWLSFCQMHSTPPGRKLELLDEAFLATFLDALQAGTIPEYNGKRAGRDEMRENLNKAPAGGGGGGGRGEAGRIFIGALPLTTTNESLEQFLSQYGSVKKIDLRYDRGTQNFRGFGFVTFDDAAVADYLVSAPLGTIVYEGRRLNCQPDGDHDSSKAKGLGKGAPVPGLPPLPAPAELPSLAPQPALGALPSPLAFAGLAGMGQHQYQLFGVQQQLQALLNPQHSLATQQAIQVAAVAQQMAAAQQAAAALAQLSSGVSAVQAPITAMTAPTAPSELNTGLTPNALLGLAGFSGTSGF